MTHDDQHSAEQAATVAAADAPTRADRPELDRRRALRFMGGFLGSAGAVTLVAACSTDATDPAKSSTTTAGSPDTTTSGSTDTATPSTTTAGNSGGTITECDPIPEETAGPFPGDGTNGPDILAEDGVVRADITQSIGDASGTASGIPLDIIVSLVDTSNSCAPLTQAAVYVWHCDREGRYSMYSDGATDENYLRGVQPADSSGQVRFTSVFPACYPGRWPHIHFEVFENVAAATGGGRPLAVSQIALPQPICEAVYATEGYEQSVGSLSRLSLSSDGVFRDDSAVHQLGTVTGSVDAGYTVALTVGV